MYDPNIFLHVSFTRHKAKGVDLDSDLHHHDHQQDDDHDHHQDDDHDHHDRHRDHNSSHHDHH